MKTKIFLSLASLAMGLCLASCEDEENYSVSTSPVISEQSVVTGSSDVTATSATLHATVSGNLGQLAASSYQAGFLYGRSADALTESANGSISEGTLVADIKGLLNGVTYYYQAFVKLQGKLTYSGEVKTFVTTNTKVTTADAQSIDYVSAILGGQLADAPADAQCGVVISAKSDEESVRSGLIVAADKLETSFTVNKLGLVSGQTYYYAAYVNVGTGVVYGDVKPFTTKALDFDVDNDLVDLGLSVKWAKFNVGAADASQAGGLFGYGDITGCQNSINLADYAQGNTYKSSADVAYLATGGKAVLPTVEDFDELFALCKSEWTEQDGVKGYKFTGPNGNSIFMPAAGSRTQNEVSAAGTMGYYMTGTANAANANFAVAYQFAQGQQSKTTTPVYQALSVRPVSTARNVKFDAELLYGTWELDLTEEGEYQIFPGPVYFMGLDDSWETITNHKPQLGDTWCWDPDFAGNAWVIGSADAAKGSMVLGRDEAGNNTVVVTRYDAKGNEIVENGTFTIDAEQKTITLEGVDLLVTANYYAPTLIDDKRTDLKILSLDDNSLQIGVLRTDPSQGPCLVSFNYVSALSKYGYKAKLTACGPDMDAPDAWAAGVCKLPFGEACVGVPYSVTFTTSNPRTAGSVVLLEIPEFFNDNPKSFVRIDDVLLDGTSVPFNAGKFRYGNLQGDGSYRVELFNRWGGTSNDSPFSNSDGHIEDEPALAFNESIEVKFTVVSITSDGSGDWTPNIICVDPTWGAQQWGFNNNETFTVDFQDGYYSVAENDVTIKYEASGYSAGQIMCFIEVPDLYAFFPKTHSVLNSVKFDGVEPTGYDASKVVDSNENPKYRLELWNCWGLTANQGCAFGTPLADGQTIAELGFSESIEVNFSVKSLF